MGLGLRARGLLCLGLRGLRAFRVSYLRPRGLFMV